MDVVEHAAKAMKRHMLEHLPGGDQVVALATDWFLQEVERARADAHRLEILIALDLEIRMGHGPFGKGLLQELAETAHATPEVEAARAHRQITGDLAEIAAHRSS